MRSVCTDAGCPYEGKAPASGCLCLQDREDKPEGLTVYVCSRCGTQCRSEVDWCCYVSEHGIPDPVEITAVRVFREEEVRPVVEAARAAADAHPLDIDQPRLAATSGPFPEEWTR